MQGRFFRIFEVLKITAMADNAFGSEIIQRGIKKERRMVNGCREYCYVGINLKKSPSTSPYSSPSVSLINFGHPA
jgi:hypothetical protein